MRWHKGQKLAAESANGNTGTPLPGSRSSCKINPILQHEHCLQKYANTHPLRSHKSELTHHRKNRLVLTGSRPYLLPGPEKLLRRLLSCRSGAASFTRNVRPPTSLPLR
jgi:hypothetical protein